MFLNVKSCLNLLCDLNAEISNYLLCAVSPLFAWQLIWVSVGIARVSASPACYRLVWVSVLQHELNPSHRYFFFLGRICH